VSQKRLFPQRLLWRVCWILPRYKSTGEALKIISNKEQIRNFGVIAHVDHGKCVDGDSLVTLTNGEICTIRELYASQGKNDEKVLISRQLMVDSMNPESVKIEDRSATTLWNLKSERLVEIKLSDGRRAVVTPEHPFYTITSAGFLSAVRAADVKPGDQIAVAGILKSVGSEPNQLKKEIIVMLSKDPRFFAHVRVQTECLSDIIQLENDEMERKRLPVAGRKGALSNVQLSSLARSIDEGAMFVPELYDLIEFVEYRSPNSTPSENSDKIRLPRTLQDFRELFYLSGLVYGACSQTDSTTTDYRYVLTTTRRIYRKLGIQTNAQSANSLLKLDDRELRTFRFFFSRIFEYPAERNLASMSVPRLVSISQNELLSEYLRGFYDSSGVVDLTNECIRLNVSSRSLTERLPLLLLRFGISAVQSYKGSRGSVVIYGSDILKFEERINFRAPGKRRALRRLVMSTRSVQDQIVPISRDEMKTVRIALGLNPLIKSLPSYQKIELGAKAITYSNLSDIVQVFERQLSERVNLSRKASILEAVLRSSGEAGRPILFKRMTNRQRRILEGFEADGIVKRSGRNIILTAFGRDVLSVWKSLILGDAQIVSRIQSILSQWKALSKGEVQFRSVKSVKNTVGDFSVYDLTVPETHTYLANGIIVHNTTTSDSLLAACGMLSPSVAGQALALDYMPLEQQRQMTIKAANVTLYYEHEGTPYVFNMIDTPGHIDFTGKVTRSLRAIDGAVVVVDSVEGVMTQTETVTRQALEERVRPVLYINKIDRLVKELRLTPDKMLTWLANIIGEFNNLVNLYAEPEFRDKWKVSIQDNSVAFGSSKDKWGFNQAMAAKSGIKFKDVYDAYTTGDPKNLAERSPLHEAILTMVIKHHPPPHVAQGYRIPKIWKGDLNSDVGKSLLACDENGPTVMMVTNVVVDPQAGIVATGRLFSGTVRDGDTVYLLDAKREGRIQSVNMYMGNVREMVGALPAGNIPALLGLEYARSGETLSSVKGIVPFEGIKYVSEPVVTVAIEAKNPRDLPKLVDALQKMHIEDPNLIVKINEESGETLMSGMGVLHLEIATTLLQDQGLEIVTSQPLINYRETIQTKAGPIMSKSPNRHNKIYIRVEPLPEEIIAKIRSGEISETADRKGIAKMLRDMGWDSDEARSVVGVDEKGNMLLDQTKGVQFMQESMDSIRAGFDDVMNNGPLAYEYCRGVKVVIHHFVPHEDPAHRTYAQLMPAARRAILGAMLLAQPVLLEPIQGIEVKCGVDQIGDVTRVLSSKRGKLLNIDQKEVLAIIEGEIPAAETFDLSEVMRGATAGKAVWNLHFKSWSPLPASLQKSVIAQVRKRKGLPEEVPPATDFIDTE
jgi:elongation factor 2